MAGIPTFTISDVFTQQRFGGNPLAVVQNAEALSSGQMQKIAREFNFSETTFVLPAERRGDFRVRIFTPSSEMPFAGHPNIGTAIVLAKQGLLAGRDHFVFEEVAGDVSVFVHETDGDYSAELIAPETLRLNEQLPLDLVAAALSIEVSCIVTQRHPPLVASVGFPFIFVELNNQQSLQRARVDMHHLEAIRELTQAPFFHLYCQSNDEFDWRCRMFAPTEGVDEDPATGSANVCLAGLLAHFDTSDNRQYQWTVAQGVEMGRPSVLHISAHKTNGQVVETRVGGHAVLFASGQIIL